MYTSIQRAPGRPNDLFVSRGDGRIYPSGSDDQTTQSLLCQLPTADYAVGGGYWGLLGFTFAPIRHPSGNVYVHVADDRTTSNPRAAAQHSSLDLHTAIQSHQPSLKLSRARHGHPTF